MSANLDKMSIRIFSDGHSFPEKELATSTTAPRVELCTRRTQLLPAACYGEAEGRELLSLAGLAPEEQEQIVCSEEMEGMVALMAFDAALLRRLPATCRFSSPLLTAPKLRDGVWMMPLRGLLYIKVWQGGKVRLAEVVDAATEDEQLYYALQLASKLALPTPKLHWQGPLSSGFKRQLKQAYSSILCV